MFTVTQLQVLQNALASGMTRVTYNGRTIDYQSIDQLIKAIEFIRGEINSQNGLASARQVRTYTSKGLGPTTLFYSGFEQQ
jgi:hypothetical protein